MRFFKFVLFTVVIVALIIIGIIVMQKRSTNVATLKSENRANNFSTKTIASNQWYSSVYKKFPTQPMFAFPLAYKIGEQGLAVSFPNVTKTPETIFASFIEDFSIGLTDSLNKPQIEKIGNWSIGLLMKNKTDKYLRFTIAQGLPSTVLETNAEELHVRISDTYKFFDQGTTEIETKNNVVTTSEFQIEVRGHNYIVVLPKESEVQLKPKEIIIKNQKVFVGLLDKPENFSLFKEASLAKVTDTTVNWSIKNNKLFTNYAFVTNSADPLIALLPHQYESLSKKSEVLGSYETLRGKMQLIRASSFTTTTDLITPDTTFASLKSDHTDFIEALKQDQKQILKDNQPTNGDYFLGAWYGKASTILLLLDSAGLEKEKKELIGFLKPRLIESLKYFTYQEKQQSIIADKPEFGNENLNDHHFHYGYFIRTAAVLSKLDPTFKQEVEKAVAPLVQDIASTDRNAGKFPFLRNFAIYEAHSFADGYADFGDGNNQESSSEAIGAWYSVYLWAKVTNDKNLEATALYLYNSEIEGARYYWFGKNELYTKPYNHAIGSLVWGGKVDFSTWFSEKTNMKYGIQLLPITPGSFSYLGTFADFKKYENDYYNHKGNISDEWGDLFVMWTSFYDSQKALNLKDGVKKFEANNPKSLFLYTLYHNSK